MIRIIALIFFSTALVSETPSRTTSGLRFTWGADGLSSLQYRGTEFLSRGQFIVNSVQFSDEHGNRPVISYSSMTPYQKIKPDAAILTFDWGTVTVDYRVDKSNLNLRITVANRSALTLTQLSLDALALQLPSTPRQYDGKQPMLGTNIGEPTVLPLDFRGGSIVVTNNDVTKPLLLGMPWSLNQPTKTIFPVRINIGRDAMYPNSLPLINRPIAPGANDQYNISLRFSNTASEVSHSTSDLLRRVAGLNEFSLHWPDRRPIGSLILATAATGWSTNPRGWLLDPKIDIHTPEGVNEFRARILAWADQSVAILKKMNAQGMITWDIEGEQFAHPITYVGDPSAVEKTAPEMAAIADDYFKKFSSAGLRVGVTVRPQKFELTGNVAKQVESADPGAELVRKIAFAKKRWGATLFYIDSNGDAVNPLSAGVIDTVAKTFPDVLLIPEHKNVAYYAKCAPYTEARSGHYATFGLATAVYPRAFSVINVADADVARHDSELQAGVNRGDILMFRGWFNDPSNATVKTIYAHSKFRGQ